MDYVYLSRKKDLNLFDIQIEVSMDDISVWTKLINMIEILAKTSCADKR